MPAYSNIDALVAQRKELVEELLCSAAPRPHRRHNWRDDGTEDRLNFVELQRRPVAGKAWSDVRDWRDLRVIKTCQGKWRLMAEPEQRLLRDASNVLDGVARYQGESYIAGSDGERTLQIEMDYRGLDLDKWRLLCQQQHPDHVNPFAKVPFWLSLVWHLLERALLPFHALGYVHCDLKPDNLCIPGFNVNKDGNEILGKLNLYDIALIDLGTALGPVWQEGGRRYRNGGAVVGQGQAKDAITRYVSDYYETAMRTQEGRLGLDGRADLYSLAYWLRRFVLEPSAKGDGPWPQAQLYGGLREGTPAQRQLLRDLPGLIWQAAQQWAAHDGQPHVELAGKIRRVLPQMQAEWFFRVPATSNAQQMEKDPSWLESNMLSFLLGLGTDQSVSGKQAPTYATPPEQQPAGKPTEVVGRDSIKQSTLPPQPQVSKPTLAQPAPRPAAPPKSSKSVWPAVMVGGVCVLAIIGFLWKSYQNYERRQEVEQFNTIAAQVIATHSINTLPDAPAATDAAPPDAPTDLSTFRDTLKDGSAGPELVVIPAGRFMMGSPESEEGQSGYEGPQHQVNVSRFALGKYAVTFHEYDLFAEATGQAKPSDEGWGRGNRPVINVSWKDAQAYATWLSEQTGQSYRLPSEAEWEYAARAGTTGPFSFSGSISPAKVNYDSSYTYGSSKGDTSSYRERTIAVGSLPPNPWGLYEVHGNVWEWVEDCWHDNYSGAPDNGSAWMSGCRDDGSRVLRGGSWGFDPWRVRSADRGNNTPDTLNHLIGFRLARTL